MGQGGGVNLIGWEPYIENKYTKGDDQCPVSALLPQLYITISISISKE